MGVERYQSVCPSGTKLCVIVRSHLGLLVALRACVLLTSADLKLRCESGSLVGGRHATACRLG